MDLPDGLPRYRAVTRALLDAIERGVHRPGDALPNEATLAAGFGVSVGTLRRAVDDLVAEHILIRRQGRGTFVATHTRDRLLFQFFHVERIDGLREAPTVELVSFERARLDDETAAALDQRPGAAAIQVDNRLMLQGRPVVHDRLWIPAALVRGLTERRWRERPGTIYQLYQSEFGITVIRARERLRAAAADRVAARILGVPVGESLLQVRRIAIGLGERPIEYRISTVHTRQHEYVATRSRPEPAGHRGE